MVTTVFARKRNEGSTSDSSLADKAAAGADLREQHEAMGSLSPKSAHHSRLTSLFGFVSSPEGSGGCPPFRSVSAHTGPCCY